jgi:hypothetical protein
MNLFFRQGFVFGTLTSAQEHRRQAHKNR